MMKRDQSKKQPKTVSSPNSNAASNKSTVTSTTNTTTTLLSPSKTAPPSATATSTTASSTQKPAAASGKPTPSSPAKPEAVSANDAFQKAFLNLSKSDQKRTVKDIKNTANLLSFFQDKQINILQLANSFGLNVDKQSENASGKMPKNNKGNPQSTSDESCSFLNLYLEASKKASENNEKIKILINQQSGDKQPHSSSDDDEEIDCLDDEYLEDDDEEDELSELDAQWEAALLDPRQHSKIVQQSQIIASINKIRSEEDKTVSDTNLLLLASTSGIYELAHCVLSPSSDGSQPPPQHSIKLLNRCLLHACAAGHAEIAKLLLEKGAEADFQTLPRKNISLHFAALHGHLNVIKLLVKHVQDRHAQDSRQISCSQFIEMANQDGHTALIHSASANHVDCAQYLIAEHNASIRCPPSAEFKDSALSLACYKGNYEMVKFLLELDNGQAFSKQELTDALLETSVEGHVDIAKLLIDKGATVITPKDSFESCLNLAAGGNHIELACLLLSKGADIEEANDEGYTPLQCSVKEMHMEMVALLLSKNADINCLNKNTKETALTLACSLNSTEIVDFLIRAGADLDLGGQTPLQVCAATGNTELAKHLLECGADINLGDPTPLQISVANENVELAKHLLECGADINLGTQTPLTAAAANGNMEMVKYLVECGADVNLGQQTALSACVTNMELAKYLIECGADINLGTPTPLQACASYGNLELAKWLVERGAEVQFGDPTPLQVCASYGYLELAKWLIECGADVNARSMTGQTALHYAFKHPQMVKLLALNGADIEAETEDGLTCLQIAIRNKNLSTIQVLVECGANIREPAVKSRKRSKNSSSSSSKSLNQSKAMKEIDPIHQKIHEQHMWLVNGEAHQFDLLEASSQRPVLCDKHANDQILPNTTRLSQTSNCSDDLDFAHGYGPQALEKITQYLQEQAALSGADSFPPPPPHSPSGKKSDGHSAKDDQFFNGINLNSMENDWLNYLSSYDREQLHQRQQQLAEKLDVQLDASNSLESRAESDKIFKEVVLRMVSERSHGGEHNDYLAVNYAADEKLSPSDIFRRKPYPLVGCNAEYLKEAERFERCISHMNASEEEQIKLKQKILLEDLHRVEKKLQDRTQATFSCGHPNLNHPNQKLIRSLCALQNQAKPKREAEKQGDNPANPQQTAANQAKLDSLSYSLKKGLYKLISSSNPKDASANCLLDNATNSATDHPDSTDSTLFNNLECLDKELSDVEFLESSKKCESQQNLASGQEKEGENAEEEPASDGEEDVKVKASKKMNRKLENLLRKPNCNLKADLSKMLSTLSPEYQPVTLAKIAEEIKKMQADISSQQGAEQCELSGEDQQPVENEESANDEELSDLFDKFEGSQIKMLKELSKLNIDYPLLAKILSEPSTSDLQSNDSQDNRAILIEETEEEDELDEEECLDEESELENSDSEDSSYSNEGDDDEEDDEEDDGEEEDDDPDEDEYYVEERLSGDHIVHERRVFNLNYPIIKEMLKDSQNLLNLRSANLERQSSSSDEHSDQEKRKKIEADPAAEQASGEQAHTCDGSSKHAHFKLLDTPEMSADIMNYIKKKQIAESRNSAAAAKAGAPTCNHVHQPGGKCVVSVSQSYVRKKPAGGTEQVTCEHHHGGGGGEDRDAKIESLCNRVISREYNELCNELKMKYSGNSSGASAAASNSKQAAFASFDSISKDDVESWKMFEQIMKFNKIKNENPENKEKINEINHWFHEVSKDPLLLTKLERISGAKRAADPQNKENAASPMNESQTSLLVVENEGKGNLKLTSKAKKLIKSTMKNSKLLNSNSSQPANNSGSSSSVRIQSTTINNPHLNSSNPQSLKNHVRNIMKAKRTLNQTTITEERHTQVTISSHASGNSCSKLDLKLLEEALPPEKYNHLLNQLNNYSCFGNPQAKTQSSAAASKSTTAAAVAAASAVAGKLQQANIARNPTNAKHDEKLANSDKNHDSALIIACEHGSVELLNAVLTHGSKEAIDHRDRKGFTGLHHAAQRGYLEIMDILVKHGADIDAEDKQNNTPLLIAATYGQVEAVQKLIGWGSKPTKQDKKHQSILHCASKNNKSEVIKYLLNNCPVNDLGLDVKDKKHQTALHFAVINSDLEVVNKLIECGASIAIKDKSERTVFHWSALKGSADILERLLQNKDSVDLNCRDVEGKSALHLASEFGHKECCSMLLKNGADLYSNDNEGRTALHLAVMNNHHTTLEVLLEKGAPINAVSGRQQTPLHIACEMGYTASARVLLRNKADFMAPEKATGKTPLFIAASGGHVEIGKLLIEISKGMDINSQPVLASKDTALTISADKGHCKFVQLLIDNGAQLDVKNKRGNTALWLGCNSGHLDVVQALIEAGAEVDSQDNRKVSCIMAAFRRGHVKVVKWLVKYITQIPSDNEMLRYISTLDDEEMIKRCRACMDVINDEKSKQAAQANNVAKTLLDELNFEKEQEEAKKMGKKLAASKKRERKKLKRKECKVEEEPPTNDKKKNKQKQSKSATPPPPPPPPVEPPAEPEKREEEEDEQDNEIDRVEMPEIAEVKKSSKNKKNEKEQQQKNAEKAKEPVASAKEAEPSKKSNAGKNEAKATKDKKKREPEPTTNRTGKNADKADKTDRNEKRENDKTNKKSSSKNEDSQPSASSKTAEQPSEKAVASGTKNLSLPANAGNSQSPSSSAESGSDKEKGRTPAAIAPKQQKEDDWKEVVRRQKKINVPANAISRVIGRGGCNIKLVREISGAYIDIENQRNSQGEIIKTGGDRQIIIKGSNEATKTAYQLIQSFVNEPEKDTDAILTQLGLPKPILPSAGESSKATSGVSAKANLLAANPASSRQSTSAVGANNGACKTSPIGSRDQHQQPKYQQLASEPAFSKSNNSSLNSSRKNSSGTSYDAPHEEANSSQKSSICNVSSSAEKSNDSISSRPNNKSELMVSTASPAANEPPPNPTSMSREPGYFSPFDSILGKVAQETIWSTKETKLNFASVAAAGLNASSSASTASNNSNSSLNNKKTKEIQVDISKAPGYRNVNLSPNYTPSVSYQSHGPTTSAVGSTASTSTLNQIMANNFGPIGAIGAKSAPCTPPLSSVTIKPPSFTSQHSAIQPAGVQQASLTSAFSSSLNSARSVQKILGSPTKPFGSSASSASVASAFAQPPPFSTSSSSAYHPTKNFTAASSFSGSSRVFHDSTSNLLSNSDLSGDPLFNAMNTSTNSSSLNPAMQLANPTSYQQSSSQSSSSFLPMQSTASFIGQPPQQQATISSLSSPQQQAATQPLASNLQLQMRAALLAAGAQLQAARIQQTNPFIPKPPQLSNLNPPDQSTDKMRMLQQMQQQYQMSYLRGQPQGGQQSQFSAQASTSANPIGSRLGSNVQLPKLSNQQQLPSMSKLPVASNFSPNSSKFVAPFHQQSSTSLNTQNQLSSFAAGSQPSLQLNNPAQMLSSSQQQQQQLQQLFANASKLGEQQYAGETSGTAVSEEKRLPRPIGTERAQRKLLPETFDLGSSFNQWPSDHQDDWSNANSPSLSQFNSPNTLQLLNYENNLFNGLTNPSLLTGDTTTPDDYWSSSDTNSSTNKLSGWQD